MSIRDRQLERVENQVVDKALRAGYTPTLTEVQTELSRSFANRPPGRPTFRPVVAEKGQRSDPTVYNQMVSELRADLEVAYAEALYQERRMMSLADYYETQKRRMQIELRALASQSGALLERIKAGAAQAVAFDSFTDFNAIELDGDSARHVPSTTCFVNLETGEALLDYAVKGAGIVDLTGAWAHIKPQQARKIEVTGSLDNIFGDSVNEAFTYSFYQATPSPLTLELVVDIGRPIRANQVKMDFQSPKKADVKLAISLDDRNYRDTASPNVLAPLTWSFSEDEFQYMRFTITKDTPDSTDGVLYIYRLGIKRVSAFLLTHRDVAHLVSRPHPIGKVISHVTLIPDSVVPPETSMRYYVALDRPDQPLDWREIQPGTPLAVGNLGRDSLEVNHTTPGYGAVVTSYHGLNVYQLAELSVPPKTVTLTQGDHMWRVESRTPEAPLAAGFVPTLADWTDVPIYSTRFLAAEKSSVPLEAGSLQRFTAWLYVDQDATEENVATTAPGATFSVYLNNALLKPVNGFYTYRLKAGWNQLQVCTFAAGEGLVFKPGLYLGGLASRILAYRDPVEQVGILELVHNSSKYDRTRFAVDGNRLVISYNPVAADADGKGVRYGVEYEYVPEGAQPSDVRFMAIMGRKPHVADVSPRLRSYKLVVE